MMTAVSSGLGLGVMGGKKSTLMLSSSIGLRRSAAGGKSTSLTVSCPLSRNVSRTLRENFCSRSLRPTNRILHPVF